MSDKLTRIAIVSADKCKPKKCRQECKRSCPVNRMGKLCIEVEPTSKISWISEELCIGCGICAKKCPFGAIHIINLPTNLESEVTHRYSANSFKLHRLPVPRPGQVLGLVGTNGIGKSTALKILSGKMKPNLGKFDNPPDWQDILKYFRGSELQNYFTKILEDNLKAIIKPQYMRKILGDFKLDVEAGEFTDSEIIVMLGQNGTGKSTFIRLLAGLLKPDDGNSVPQLNVSYKPQKISPKFKGTVRMLFLKKIKGAFLNPQFNTDVIKPLNIENIIDQEVMHLSGGELQRVAIVLALGQPADIYLIDEPSAYLDSEQRIIAAKVIKRFILHFKRTAFIVEHDFIMATYLADRVVVYEGTPSVHAVANSPQSLLTGMNKFLASLQITFRRDPSNFRPRINKLDSQLDQEQKASGNYFFLEQ
ncbi:Putative Translation initiation factor RLI1 [Rhizopus microsporus]|nr:Putative Translation initiation factor RLI1 [Rhizopus microsporus]